MYDDDVLDEALEFLSHYGPGMRNGMTSHAPMAVEALCALGRWERGADWAAYLAEELAEAPWQAVLARRTERLAPGICAAATHGVIRVAVVPPGERRVTGSIVGALATLGDHAPFAPVIDWLDVEMPVDAAITELTEAFARACLANIHDGLSAVVFVHGVTSSAALRALVPHLDEAVTRNVLRHAWQAGAALYTAFGTQPPATGMIALPETDADALTARAIVNGDEHAIEIVEACVTEFARHPSPVYLAAADRALGVLGPPPI